MPTDRVQTELPVQDCLDRVIKSLAAGRNVILRAPPGAGKTTGVPPAIHHARIAAGQILLLQPRRLAARAAAHRLSTLVGESVGQTYGYHVRFDRQVGPRTQVIAMTTGVLLRRLSEDPFLDGIGCVIVDEFHERSLDADLVLGMLHRLRTTVRPELQLVVMSATLETGPVEQLLDQSDVIESQGRAYDVEVRYDTSLARPATAPREIAQAVIQRMPDAFSATDGDVLVFLPGVGEINRVAEALVDFANRCDVDVRKLYGDLSLEQQDAVLAPSPRRKIVLATNVAETSVTIPGVTCVVDTGLARVMTFDNAVGLPSLRLQPISQASADQRSGRAGRTAPGVCFRMWPMAMHRSRPEHTLPEVTAADLSSALLTLASWGERDVFAFPWVTPPKPHAVDAGHRLLRRLDAIDEQGAITATGRQINALPVHPRLARFLFAAQEWGCVDQAALAAAVLSQRSPFERSAFQRESAGHSGQCDLYERVRRLDQHLQGRADPGIHAGGAKTIERVAKQLKRMLPADANETGGKSIPQNPPADLESRFARALLAAYPDRLAKRRAPGDSSGVMVGGRGVQLDHSSRVRHVSVTGREELFLCIDVDGQGSESRVRMATAIDPAWLPESGVKTVVERFFSPSHETVVARERRYFEDLLLAESPTQCDADAETQAILLEHAQSKWDAILPADDQTLHGWIDRWRFLDRYASPGQLPEAVDQALERVLETLCETRTSFKELRAAPWLAYLKAPWSYSQLQWFDQQAPESLVVPSGNRIRLTYQSGKPPILAVRIQEIFGWAETPRLAGGTVPVQLHLLGPNHRPQQITDDLQSFWQTTYGEIKKELKRRYAKHHWPDDPSTAQATRNGLKPR